MENLEFLLSYAYNILAYLVGTLAMAWLLVSAIVYLVEPEDAHYRECVERVGGQFYWNMQKVNESEGEYIYWYDVFYDGIERCNSER